MRLHEKRKTHDLVVALKQFHLTRIAKREFDIEVPNPVLRIEDLSGEQARDLVELKNQRQCANFTKRLCNHQRNIPLPT